MNMNMVSLADYEGLSGFGGGAMGDAGIVDELNKAISAGYDVSNQTGGGALRPQSLESTLKVLTFQDQHIKLWKKLAKLPAYSTVEEYNQLQDYGTEQGGFFQEGGLPQEEDTTYERQTALVKFLGTTRVVTHPMTLVRSAHGDVLALEARNGTLWILRALERSLFYANSANNPLAFNGFKTQIDPSQVIDAQGMPITESLLETGAAQVAAAFGMVTDVFLSLAAMQNIAKTFFPRERVNLPAPEKGIVGVPITHFSSQNGVMQFNPDVFIQEGQPPQATAQMGAPSTSGLGIAASNATGSGSSLAAGTYGYSVSAINAKGESLAIADGNADKTATGGEYIPLVITIPTATPTFDQPSPSAYKIYRRSSLGSGAKLYLTTVVPSDDPNYTPGNATFTVNDEGLDIEGTSDAFMFDMNPSQVMAFKQLAPLMKLPLATISAAIRFMVLLYGVPILYAPKKALLIKNVGSSSTPLNLPS